MSNKGRNFWGSSAWKTIHSMAMTYTPDQKENFKQFIYYFFSLLPCKSCKKHALDNLKKLPPDDYLSSRDDLFFWTYIFHDTVNSQINAKKEQAPKISPPFLKVKAQYYSALIDDNCPDCI